MDGRTDGLVDMTSYHEIHTFAEYRGRRSIHRVVVVVVTLFIIQTVSVWGGKERGVKIIEKNLILTC